MTTPQLGSLSVPGNVGISPTDPNDMAALAAIVQESVDALTAAGINKVILTGHLQQISLDEEITMHVKDVDIIIAGGSNTLLADETDRLHPGDTGRPTLSDLDTIGNRRTDCNRGNRWELPIRRKVGRRF